MFWCWALIGIWAPGLPSDIDFQVGLITVVGLAAKNAILIVEFANALRSRGHSLRDARETAEKTAVPGLGNTGPRANTQLCCSVLGLPQ
jgi:multidrug efflux pump subunit AcrB